MHLNIFGVSVCRCAALDISLVSTLVMVVVCMADVFVVVVMLFDGGCTMA